MAGPVMSLTVIIVLQRHHLALAVADLQLADVVGPQAIAGVGLDVDLPVAVVEREVVDVGRAEVGLQRVEDVVEVHALLLALTRSTST